MLCDVGLSPVCRLDEMRDFRHRIIWLYRHFGTTACVASHSYVLLFVGMTINAFIRGVDSVPEDKGAIPKRCLESDAVSPRPPPLNLALWG